MFNIEGICFPEFREEFRKERGWQGELTAPENNQSSSWKGELPKPDRRR